MLVSTPPISPHQLANSLPSTSTSHSSLPASFSIPMTNTNTTNPCTWTVNQVEEWLNNHELNDCTNLICQQHRMDGMRLMNLKEDDVLQLKGTNKNKELWIQIKQLQQFYSSNYHLWTGPQSKPMTSNSYFLPPTSAVQRPIPLRAFPPMIPCRPSSSHSTVSFQQNSNQNQQLLLPSSQQQSQKQQQQQPTPSVPTAVLVERSPSITITRSHSSNGIRNQRSSSRSLSSTSNAPLNILPITPSQSASQRAASIPFASRRTPADQIEDQPIAGCCFVGSLRSDRKKTLTAFLLAIGTVFFCSICITIVDERLPDPLIYPPLPDLVLENIPELPWAFAVTEKLILIEVVTLITVILCHRHRLIILRRLFAIAAALYFLRSLTMVFTSLPVATRATDCKPERLAHFGARMKKATLIFLGQGMSSFGVKTCGDYLYSGHTCTLVLATHFINEYSPRSYHLLHILTWFMAITGMFFILAGHQHYSIDILIAWVLASRLFIYYHTLANNRTFLQRDTKRMRIWFPFFSYFEENIKTALPNEYCLPGVLNDAHMTLNSWIHTVRYPYPTD